MRRRCYLLCGIGFESAGPGNPKPVSMLAGKRPAERAPVCEEVEERSAGRVPVGTRLAKFAFDEKPG